MNHMKRSEMLIDLFNFFNKDKKIHSYNIINNMSYDLSYYKECIIEYEKNIFDKYFTDDIYIQKALKEYTIVGFLYGNDDKILHILFLDFENMYATIYTNTCDNNVFYKKDVEKYQRYNKIKDLMTI